MDPKGKRATKKYKSERAAPVSMKMTRIPRGLNRELKTMDVVPGGYCSTTTTITGCINIPEGSSQGQRIGRRVQIYSISFRCLFSFGLTATSAVTSDELRLTLIQDRQPNLALPAVLDFRSTTGTNSFPNPNTTKRFKTLFDHWQPLVIQLNGTGALGQGTAYVTKNWYMKKNIIIEFANSNADYTGISTNNIFVAWQGLQNSITTNSYCDCRIRIKYYDD